MLDLYRTLLRVALAVQLQYRAAGAIWMIGLILDPIVFLVVWTTVARSRGGDVGGFSPDDIAAYYIALMIVNHLTFNWVMHEMQWRIREGQFSFLLLRPVHPIHGDIADNLTYKLVMLIVLLPAVALLVLLFDPTFSAAWWAWVAFLPALAGAFALRFLLGWTLALVAFWTTRANALNELYFAALLLFSGRIAPVDLLPPWLEQLARLLPFYWVAAFPVELLLGRLSPGTALSGLGVQLLWTLLMLSALVGGWRVALRRYSAVGG